MENRNIFIITLLFIFSIFYMDITREKFNNQNTGVYNYFHEIYVNPYSQPLTKFYSNDKIQNID